MKALGALHTTLVHRRRVERIAVALDPLLPRGGTLLDIGAGDGAMAHALLSRRPDLTIHCVDPVLRPSTHVPVARLEGETLPFDAGAVDHALLVDVLHHVTTPDPLLREIRRVARRGMVIKDHRSESRWDHATLAAMDWAGNVGHGIDRIYRYWSRAEWDRVADRLDGRWVGWCDDLRLYPWPATWLCDRRLQFVARLDWGRDEGARG